MFLRDAGIALTTMREHYELETVIATGARMFCVPRADITAADLAQRFLGSIGAIAVAATSPGPFIYIVKRGGITRLL